MFVYLRPFRLEKKYKPKQIKKKDKEEENKYL